MVIPRQFQYRADFGAGAEQFFGVAIGGVAVNLEQNTGGELGEGVVMGLLGWA